MEAHASDHAPASRTLASADTHEHANADGSGKTLPSHSTIEQRIQKAEAFLTNGEIENVSASTKREFLQKKVGMSRDEVDAAMERVSRREGIDRLDDRESRRRTDDLYEMDTKDNRGNRRRYDDDLHEDRYSRDRRERDYRIDRRGPMDETTMPHTQPRYYESNNHMNPYGHSLSPDQIDERVKSSGFSFTSWAGGFSFGVFCLAALRWLNGGDFVLFPPPSASDSLRAQSRHIQKERRSDENDAEDNGELGEQDEGLARLLDGVTEENEEEADDNFDLNDDALNSILNGTANANNLHPADVQPSYQDLISEIRTLTSAVQSYCEEQERANRAAAVKVGRGVTDDVMGFLREDKNKSKGCEESAADNVDVSSVVSALMEISEDLLRLKHGLAVPSKETKDGNDTHDVDLKGQRTVKGDFDETSYSSQTDDNLPDGTGMLTIVDSSVEKLQKIIDAIKLTKQNQSDDNEQVLSNTATTTQLAPTADKTPSDTDVKNEEQRNQTVETEPSGEPEFTTQEAEQAAKESSVENGEDAHNNLTVATGESDKQDAAVEPETSGEPESKTQDVELALRTLSSGNNEEELKVGAQMLYLYCLNISKNPTVPRYRKIYTNNNSFQKKVGSLKGAKELLCAVGFVEKANFFEWATPNNSTIETQSSLDLAVVALDMMRKGTQSEDQTSNVTIHPECGDLFHTTLPYSKVASPSNGCEKSAESM